MRVQVKTNDPRPSREATQAFPVRSEPGQALVQLTDDGVQMVKHPVGEFFLAQLIPDMFLRIQFGRVGRQGQQPNVLGNRQVFSLMRTGSIQHHQDEVAGMGLAHLRQKFAHARGVHFVAHLPIQLASQGADRAIDINKLPLVTVAQHGAERGRSPAAFGAYHAPEAGLVLKHQTYRAPLHYRRGQPGCQRFGEFFSTPPGPPDRTSGGAYRAQLSASRGAPKDGTPPRGRFSAPIFPPTRHAEGKPPAPPPATPVRPTERGTLLPPPSSATPVAVHPTSCGAAKAPAGSGEIVVAADAPKPVPLRAKRPFVPGWYQ